MKKMIVGNFKNKKGFTLAEVLIVVAIVAVLVGVSIPIFSKHLEKAREGVDLSNVRTAYSVVMSAAMLHDDVVTYDDTPIAQSDGTYKVIVSPLKQQQGGWSTDVSNISIGGVKSSDWKHEPIKGGSCTIIYNPDTGVTTIDWLPDFTTASLMDLKRISNDERVAKDQDTLKRMGQAILDQGWTIQDLKDNLGLPETSGGAIRIADYYQHKSGSFSSDYESAGFEITTMTNGNMNVILNAIGYDGGTVKKTAEEGQRTYTTYTNSMFFSDQLAANKYKNYDYKQNKRSIIIENIKIDNSTKTIKSFTIYSKAMDGQANLENDNALFRITVSK